MEQTVNPIRRGDTTASKPSRAAYGASPAEIDAARYYDEIFVPALFAQWVEPLARAAGVKPGQRLLDVACGSGIVARELVRTLAPRPRLSGLDIAPGMLEIASQRLPDADWRQGSAGDLPYADASFDRVLCQFGLMFFEDPVAAIGEMLRVLTVEGRLALSVWDALEENPGFARKVEILERMAGREAAAALRAPFCLGARNGLHQLAERAGLREIELKSCRGQARFANLSQFVDAELRGWLPVMGVYLDDDLIDAIRLECAREFGTGSADEAFVMPVTALLLSGSMGEA